MPKVYKNKHISFKATKIEYLLLERICEIEGRTISEMLRELIREGAISRGINIKGMILDLMDEKGNIE